MEEFYRRFEATAREMFPNQEFKTWEELTPEDLVKLEDVYKRFIIAQDVRAMDQRVQEMREYWQDIDSDEEE